MWSWLESVWGSVSDYAGEAYDYVSDYAGEAYDYVVGSDLMDTYYNATDQYETGSSYSGVLGVAKDAIGGFLDIAAAPSKAGMPPSQRRRVSAPRSTAGAGQFTNLAKVTWQVLSLGTHRE
jgi:hypothetical protein